ncbi:unnamed protein product [Effrenium voratum]|nr:unnamed protein product [Effrenium voratum]
MASELPAVRAKWMPPEVNEEAKLIESPAPHFTPRPQQSNPGYMRQYIMSDLERWRQLFREEARKCAAELRATLLEQEELRGRDVSFEPDIGFETEGSRKAEAETELLRSHVEELLRLNSSLRQATLDQLSSKEFGKLRGCVVDLTKEVQALMGAKRQEHPVEIAKVAADAASKALASAERQVMKNLNASLEAQQKVLEGRWKSEDERWSALDKEVASLREQTKLIEDVSAQALEGAGERMVEQLMARLEPLLEAGGSANYGVSSDVATRETKLKTSGSGLSGGEEWSLDLRFCEWTWDPTPVSLQKAVF